MIFHHFYNLFYLKGSKLPLICSVCSYHRYTVLCSSRRSYMVPKKEEDWPKCVKTCWRKLPPVPIETGLAQKWVRPNKVPAGQYGQYRCVDSSQGMGPFISRDVEKKGGPRNYYRSKIISFYFFDPLTFIEASLIQ